MRFDLLTIFPQYFDALDLSLIGKARAAGELSAHVTDLRDYAAGKHRSVDDTPTGGGAGMVMRPDVWGRAIDRALAQPLISAQSAEGAQAPAAGQLRAPRRVLAIPTPAGTPLTQRHLEDLAGADQIVVACGRYEGIDARVAEHYRSRGAEPMDSAADSADAAGVAGEEPAVEVFEFSLGDYVLNGGEVAALALVEGIGRLSPGVVGNPASLDEESHSTSGLLEYPAYTKPRDWRNLGTPPALLSGDHARIARWRRDRALERTAATRPDLVAALDPADLDARDREVLALAGLLAPPLSGAVHFRVATESDAEAVSALAARTFPDACPPEVTPEDVEVFVREQLSPRAMAAYIADPGSLVLVAEVAAPARGLGAEPKSGQSPGELAAYTLLQRTCPPNLGRAPADAGYLSKCYTDQRYRGSGVTAAILTESLTVARDLWDLGAVALATHIGNKRAARFYRRSGFRKAGRRTFLVGDVVNTDDVFVRRLASGLVDG